jgi:hypothetical protein
MQTAEHSLSVVMESMESVNGTIFARLVEVNYVRQLGKRFIAERLKSDLTRKATDARRGSDG